jgi:5'-nucleotidase
VDALAPVGTVIVAAPAFEQSGKGHSLTLREPIMVSERKQPNGATWYAIDAPPATCVRLALESLLDRRPDIVISGINRGDNLGATVYHSGTLGAAREAVFSGVPAIAVSMRGDEMKDYLATAAYIRRLITELRSQGLLKSGLFLNVNAPAGGFQGVRVTRLSMKLRPDGYERRISPRGRLYFWPVWEQLKDEAEGTDVWAFVRGFITITPMVLDVTDGKELESYMFLNAAGASAARAQ